MSRSRWITEIEKQAQGKPVLLVEGNIDVDILTYFLHKISLDWEAWIVLRSAGFKSRVIEGVRDYYPNDWAGVVDRDEWPPDAVQAELKDISQVKVLPRFCLENYFCVPTELWDALPSIQQKRISDDVGDFARPILTQLPDWVAHGAMWRVIRNRRKGLLHESGFPAKLDDAPVTDLDEIMVILQAWHDQLDPDQIISAYQQELSQAKKLSPNQQLKTYIHGKKFFRQVVVPTLNQFYKPTGANTWLQRFSQPEMARLIVPPDLKEFLAEILGILKEDQ